MTSTAVLVLAAAGIAAVVDWWSVATGRRSIEIVAKPATLALLVGAALAIDPATPTIRALFVAGLVLSLAGDVFLLMDTRWFVAGLGAFLAAHIAYTVGLVDAGLDLRAVAVGVVLVILAIVTTGWRIQRAASGADRRLGIPVAGYIVAISAMLVAAVGTMNPAATVGAGLFYLSDTILGWNRFVAPLPHGRLLTMMAYHGAQALLVIALGSL
ncbi:MAG: lysoplasmalogenase [Acidimicrobiia bacterium]